MPRRRLIVLAFLPLLVACEGGRESAVGAGVADADPLAAGRAAYLAHCSACHQREGQGLRGAFPPLAGADWLRAHPPELAIEVVLRGMTGELTVNGETYRAVMPPAAHLDDARIAAILGYVYASWGNEAREITPAMVAAVRARSAAPVDAGALPKR